MSENRAGTRLLRLQERETGVLKEKQLVQTEAQFRLRCSCYLELHLVSCDFHEGVLTLRGRVPSFYLKQIAQTLILNLNGVGAVNNRLEVCSPPICP